MLLEYLHHIAAFPIYCFRHCITALSDNIPPDLQILSLLLQNGDNGGFIYSCCRVCICCLLAGEGSDRVFLAIKYKSQLATERTADRRGDSGEGLIDASLRLSRTDGRNPGEPPCSATGKIASRSQAHWRAIIDFSAGIFQIAS